MMFPPFCLLGVAPMTAMPFGLKKKSMNDAPVFA
jgi:hypothetical protein